MRYAVTVEPEDRRGHPTASLVSSTVEADDKDAALEAAEASYRESHPGVGRLKVRVVRLRPRGVGRRD